MKVRANSLPAPRQKAADGIYGRAVQTVGQRIWRIGDVWNGRARRQGEDLSSPSRADLYQPSTTHYPLLQRVAKSCLANAGG